MEDLAKHLNHPFYAESSNYREHIRLGQIMKGAEKYPEPYSPENYTAKEQIEHFMQENVDQAHYAYGLYKTVEKLEKENWQLKEKVEELLFIIEGLQK
jgi:hypothetical protein